MKRTLLLLIALAACGDDAGPNEDDAPPIGEKDVAAREDATVPSKDAGRDAAPDLLDAAMEAGPIDMSDASVPDAVVDAASFDATTDADAQASECVELGGDCQTDSCCAGSACVTTTEAPYPACAKVCNEPSECESGCCTLLAASGNDKVCVPQMYCEQEDPKAPLKGISCINDLEVYDSSGTYMGKATTSPFEDDSVCDNFGPYGEYGSHPDKMWSIGSDAYSTTLGFPAVLGCGSDWPVLAYVAKYKGKADKRVVDPDHLCDVLENSGF
jgi:hypothetical protein